LPVRDYRASKARGQAASPTVGGRAAPAAAIMGRTQASPVWPAPVQPIAPVFWKALLVGGSNLIDGYDNAATDLAWRLRLNGVGRIALLRSGGSSSVDARSDMQRRKLQLAMNALGSTPDDACLVFITSHASERGFHLSGEREALGPRDLSQLVDAECGARPTVLVLSGCGTGAFITTGLTGDNRIVLAASARDRVSYGATTADRYVNFDRCMIKAIDSGARTWKNVFERTLPCVDERERMLGVAASQPQAWFGAHVTHLALPGRQ
jgi:hypothetical protein